MKQRVTERVDAITQIPDDYLAPVIPAPPSVKIELTSRCDLRCGFCATSKSLRTTGDMDFEFYRTLLRDLKAAGVCEIGVFYLGESLLYHRLAKAIQEAKTVGFEYVFLTTNGRLLTEAKARAIIGAGLDSLKFSFNAADRDDYLRTTGKDGFDRMVANITTCRAVRDEIFAGTGHWCGLYASTIWRNDYRPPEMRAALDLIDADVDEHYWLPLYNQAGILNPAPGYDMTPGDMGRIGALRAPVPCWCLFRTGHVTWDGILTGCAFAHEAKWDFGDLKVISFMDAWNSPAAQALRQAHLAGNVKETACEECIRE